MRLPRFRVRTMMLVVVVAGIAIGGYATVRRKHVLLARANVFASRAEERRRHARELELRIHALATVEEQDRQALRTARSDVERAWQLDALQWTKDELAPLRKEYESESQIAAYYDSLNAKYREAALRPWLPVEPDPPEPK